MYVTKNSSLDRVKETKKRDCCGSLFFCTNYLTPQIYPYSQISFPMIKYRKSILEMYRKYE